MMVAVNDGSGREAGGPDGLALRSGSTSLAVADAPAGSMVAPLPSGVGGWQSPPAEGGQYATAEDVVGLQGSLDRLTQEVLALAVNAAESHSAQASQHLQVQEALQSELSDETGRWTERLDALEVGQKALEVDQKAFGVDQKALESAGQLRDERVGTLSEAVSTQNDRLTVTSHASCRRCVWCLCLA